jgi:hypothetical protein
MSQLYLIYRRDWEQIRDQNAFIDRDTAQILVAVTDHKSLKHMIAKTKGGFRMCTALDELCEEVGKEKYEQGIDRGIELSIKNLMETMKLSAKQAMDALKIPEEERAVYLKRL